MIPAPPLVSQVPTEAEAWAIRRRLYWRAHPYRCHRCNRRGDRCDKRRWLHVHHLGYWYPKGYEPDGVLIGLCQRCHRKRPHPARPSPPSRPSALPLPRPHDQLVRPLRADDPVAVDVLMATRPAPVAAKQRSSRDRTTRSTTRPLTQEEQLSKAGTKRLREAEITLAVVQRMYPRASDTVNLLAQVLRGTDYDGNVRSGISDPTPAQAFQLEPWHIWERDVDHNIVLVVHHVNELFRLMNKAPSDIDTKALVRQHQCRGGTGPAWSSLRAGRSPACARALYDTRDGLCSRCYQRRWKWSREHSSIEGAA